MQILVTGAAASGKSSYAEGRALETNAPLVYIATMRVISDEDKKRVIRHRELREGKGFTTRELSCARDLTESLDCIPTHATVLLEDLGNFTSNSLFDDQGHMHDASVAYDEIIRGLECLEQRATNLIVVTNEIGSGIEQETAEIDAYITLLGRLSCRCAAIYDEVFELACGIPTRVK